MPVMDEILAANETFAAGFTKGDLPRSPGRRIAIVTCMDARLDPARFAGLAEGDAHVIRNAGGIVTDDVLRSLVISHWLLGSQDALVIGHTDCGMETFTDDQLRQKLANEAGVDSGDLDFHAFPDVRLRVAESVARIRDNGLLPVSFTATGFIYDVRTGRLEPVT